MTAKVGESGLSMTAVIVLYRRLPAESESLTTLLRAYEVAGRAGVRLQTLLYDNTPGGQDVGALPEGVEYVMGGGNRGLAAAYNWAQERAEENGSGWLLTLDQDTRLPENFLAEMGGIASEVKETPMVGAIAPQIVESGRALSPYRFAWGAVPRWYVPGFHGLGMDGTYAFNSAALIRLSTLRQVGGYNPWFWLDNSDAWLFRQMQRYGKRVFVAGTVRVEHDFSMMDMRNRVSAVRYRNVLLAESAFWDMEMSALAGWERTARLVNRMVQHWRRTDPVELRRVTGEFLRRRLVWARRRRVRAWRKETLEIFPELGAEKRAGRPRVSVCMAAYNGAPYIAEQMRSILEQIGPADEVVVVDDASTDGTVELIRSLGSPLVRLICRAENQGVVATFEEALRNATGDVLFLADGDDVWARNKVEMFLEVFRTRPEVKIVTSRIAFIDGQGRTIEDDLYRNRKGFEAGFWQNLMRNHFQGSAMAIRASLLGAVLPFPRQVGFLHDQWIGMRSGGAAVYLDEPLLFYRRHGNNLSRRKSRVQQLRGRIELLWTSLVAWMRDRL